MTEHNNDLNSNSGVPPLGAGGLLGVRGLNIQHLITNPAWPTIIFLHDSLGCITLWRDFPERLGRAARCNVLVYDRLGYGKSAPMPTSHRENDYLEREAETLISLMDACGLGKVILFGHSDGGSIALLAAALYPERISGVITEGAHIFVEDITLRGISEAVEAYRTTSLREKLIKHHGSNTDTLFDAWTKTWLSLAFRSWNIERFLPQVTCPVLVLQGEADEFGSLAQVNGVVSGVAGPAQRGIIPAIGHTPHKEAPETVLELTAAFIAGLGSKRMPHITHEVITAIAKSTGLQYAPDAPDGNVCLAESADVRPEYRLTFTEADVTAYLHATAQAQNASPHPDADTFWKMVKVGYKRMSP